MCSSDLMLVNTRKLLDKKVSAGVAFKRLCRGNRLYIKSWAPIKYARAAYKDATRVYRSALKVCCKTTLKNLKARFPFLEERKTFGREHILEFTENRFTYADGVVVAYEGVSIRVSLSEIGIWARMRYSDMEMVQGTKDANVVNEGSLYITQAKVDKVANEIIEFLSTHRSFFDRA